MCEHRRVAKVTGHCDAALTFEGGAVRITETFHAFPAFAMFQLFAMFAAFEAFPLFAVFAMFPVFSRTRDALKKQNKRERIEI